MCYSPTLATIVGQKDDGTNILSFRLSARGDKVQLPCGKCRECLAARMKMWCDRCLLEMQYHSSTMFVTLTYDTGHLPLTERGNATLDIRDWQLFMKRLRKKYGSLRFFMCGEYGGKSMRPHMHAIIFGLSLTDLKYYAKNMYGSKELESVWQKGFVTVCPANANTIAYVAGYVSKKLGKKKINYDTLGIKPEFINMSRNPGIGLQSYYDDPGSVYPKGHIYLTTPDGCRDIRPYKLAKEHFKIDYPDLWQEMHDQNTERMEKVLQSTLDISGMDWYTYIEHRKRAREVGDISKRDQI